MCGEDRRNANVIRGKIRTNPFVDKLEPRSRPVDASSVDPAGLLRRIDQHHRAGERSHCLDLMHELAGHSAGQFTVLQELGLRYTLLGLHHEAEHCYRQALALRPGDARALYNHATALTALGELDEAEALLDEVIARTPADADAWYNRATLRRQTPARNHVAAIERQLASTAATAEARIALHYALAKEYEDLGRHPESFAALQRGADARRQRMAYRVEDDLDTMQQLASVFDAQFFQREGTGHDDARPIFIVGLPRSGTTLVDRILSAHPQVSSRGESPDLAQCVVRGSGPARTRAELIERSARMDFAALGRAYCSTLPAGPHTRVIDKTPGNFLYLGLIARALPRARIIHLRRKPMDACYAIYKTLFRMAYPFSYSQQDLGRYWLGYHALMAHWREVLPQGMLLEIDYEALVDAQEASSRALVAHAGLPWDEACLHFERNAQPTLTASAAQVRQPIYRSSLGLWRRYADQLAPLRRILEVAGVSIASHPETNP